MAPLPPLGDLLGLASYVEPSEYQPLLEDLQCNILSSHGRQHTHHFFLDFSALADVAAVKSVLKALAFNTWKGAHADLGIDSELESLASRLVRGSWAATALGVTVARYTCSLLLSHAAYLLLHLAPPVSEAFGAGGMGARDAALPVEHKLHDRPVSAVPGELTAVHALFMVGHDDDDATWAQTRTAIRKYLDSVSVAVHEEAGYKLMHSGKVIEPFGYRDSLRQPRFYAAPQGTSPATTPGTPSGATPLGVALVPDPHGQTNYSCGSFAVFRKLSQDVSLFYRQAAALATQRRCTWEQVADGLIGRTVDGKPLDDVPDYTDFRRSVCPMHAHVRKVNPPHDGREKRRELVRRSSVFGPTLLRANDGRPLFADGNQLQYADHGGAAGNADIGLLFLCFQSDIRDQFEHIQGAWANWTPRGADTVIGQVPAGATNLINVNSSGPTLPYAPVVTLAWGEYLFAPSLSFFSSL